MSQVNSNLQYRDAVHQLGCPARPSDRLAGALDKLDLVIPGLASDRQVQRQLQPSPRELNRRHSLLRPANRLVASQIETGLLP